MTRIRMNKTDLYAGEVTLPVVGKYIPQLNLFYNEETDTYYNEYGKVAPIHIPKTDNDIDSSSIKKSHFSLDVVLQILALVLAAAAQYNVLENKITESENQLAVYKAVTDEKFNNVPQLLRDMDLLRMKQEELIREIDELKFKTSKK